MKEAGIEDPNDIAAVRKLGVIDLPTMQKKANLHFSLSLDLFGSEVSTNAANYYNSGVKGRFQETRIEDDHQLTKRHLPGEQAGRRQDQDGGRAGADRHQHAPARRLRDRLRQGRGALEQGDREDRRRPSGSSCRTSPSTATSASSRTSRRRPDGEVLSDAEWAKRKDQWLPSKADGDFIAEPDGALLGARQVRLLDRPAQGRHRQQGRATSST